MTTLTLTPTTYGEACEFVGRHHRHHPPPQGHKYSIAISADESVVGVVMVGRPVARHMDDGWTLEVTRLCVMEGVSNACSKLYGAAWRAAKALGYKKLITYTLKSESGSSLCGAGWKCIGEAGGGSWTSSNRPRVDKHPTQIKLRWEVA